MFCTLAEKETETAGRDKGPTEVKEKNKENTELNAEQIENKCEIATEIPGTWKLNRFMKKLAFNIFLVNLNICGGKI